ncbi:hypothetical protein FHN55_06025 [Streptomyces sp. NP160]|nr:hypothetical protein FHN55_06025 [Streptomyces sp. NP160]
MVGTTLTVVAGTGVAGAASSGTGATTQLDRPQAVAVDSSSTLFVADTGNGLVRSVSAGGAVTTAATTPAPDALVVTGSGDVLVGSTTSVAAVSGSTSSAVGTGGFRDVEGLAVSGSGVVWVADAAGSSSAVVTLTPPPPAAAPVRITSTPPTTAVRGAALTRTFTATGTPTITWSFVGGAAPACLGPGAIGATTGVLTATPATSGRCTFTVRADNSVTHDDQEVTLAVGAAPAATSAKPTATAGQGSATVTWAAPAASTAAGEAVTGYVVTPTAGGTAGTPRSVAAGTLSTTFTGLRAGTSYTFTVAATNAFGTAPVSPASAAVVPYGGIAAPGPGLTRYQGSNRVLTAVKVSQQLFPDAGSARAVVVASSTSYADSLAGARLAAAVGAPLLLTDPLALNAEVAAEVGRVLAVPATTTAAPVALAAADASTTAKPTTTGTVYLLGGTSAVSAAAETALKAVSSKYTVTRLSGADRYETAVKIAAQTAVDDPVPGAPVYVASGANYPDGLAVAALASRTGGVVLLTQGSTMPAATLAYLETYDPNSELLVAVGGPAAAATSGHGAERAIVGADRYDTARLVAARFTAATGAARVDDVGLATGTNWPDALAGAAAMGNLDGPLLLTPPDALSPAVGSALSALSKAGRPTSALVFGGPSVVSSSTADAFAARVAG